MRLDAVERAIPVEGCAVAAIIKHASQRGRVLLADGREAVLQCWESEGVTSGGSGTATVKLEGGSHVRVQKRDVLVLLDPSESVLAKAGVC